MSAALLTIRQLANQKDLEWDITVTPEMIEELDACNDFRELASV